MRCQWQLPPAAPPNLWPSLSDLPPLGRTAINDVVSPYNLHVLISTSLHSFLLLFIFRSSSSLADHSPALSARRPPGAHPSLPSPPPPILPDLGSADRKDSFHHDHPHPGEHTTTSAYRKVPCCTSHSASMSFKFKFMHSPSTLDSFARF